MRCNIQETKFKSLASSTSALSGASTNSQAVTEAALVKSSTTTATTTQNPSTSTSGLVLTPVPQSATSTPTASSEAPGAVPSSGPSLSTETIAGIAVGGSLAVLIVLAGLLLWKRRSSKKKVTTVYKTNSDHSVQRPPAYSAYYIKPELLDKTSRQELSSRWSKRTEPPVELATERY